MCRTSWQGGSLALCFGRAWGVWQQRWSKRWDGCCAPLFLALRAAFGFCLVVKQTMEEGITEQGAICPLNLPGGKLHQRWSSRDWEQAWKANEFWVPILRCCKLHYLLKSISWKKEFTETRSSHTDQSVRGNQQEIKYLFSIFPSDPLPPGMVAWKGCGVPRSPLPQNPAQLPYSQTEVQQKPCQTNLWSFGWLSGEQRKTCKK